MARLDPTNLDNTGLRIWLGRTAVAESSAINSRQRVLAAVCHQPIDRVPIDIWAVPEVWRQLGQYFKTDDRMRNNGTSGPTALQLIPVP